MEARKIAPPSQTGECATALADRPLLATDFIPKDMEAGQSRRWLLPRNSKPTMVLSMALSTPEDGGNNKEHSR